MGIFRPSGNNLELFDELANEHLDCDQDDWNAKREYVYGLIDESVDPRLSDAVQAWLRECYHPPRRSAQVMCALNEVLGGCGVEAIHMEGEWDAHYHDAVASYVNMGDPYVITVVLDHRDETFHVTDWGGWLEAYEQEQEDRRKDGEDY